MTPAPQTPTPKVWTIKQLLSWTTDFLKSKGNDDAKREAELRLSHVLNCKRVDLFVRFEEQPSEADRTKFRELIQRRVTGCPVAYLVGSREFYLLNFEVSPAVLIPRPDTETL